MTFFEKSLNAEQYKVVSTTDGPVLVLAGAGSGKTRSVIFRAAYLINEKKVHPWNILIVTFTNKAAQELRERLQSSFGLNTRALWVGTFHSICTRILRKEAEFTAYNSNFSIYDKDDQKAVLKNIYKKHNISTEKFPIAKVADIIGKQKNNLTKPEQFFEFNDKNKYSDVIAKIYTDYQNYLIASNAMDFDDLLMNTAYLLHENAELRQRYEAQFAYIMIDEYQDTNFAQFRIINLLASGHQNLCVVGDDDQAIYSWRGADLRNILQFEKDYKKVVTVKLEENYRSTEAILKVANCLIKQNKNRHAKELRTNQGVGEKPKLMPLDNEAEEADFIIRDLQKRMQEDNSQFSDFVVLYRTNFQSRILETTFTKRGIPYRIIGNVGFFQRKEIKDLMSYIKLLVNPLDNESFFRIINCPPRGIGETTIGKMVNIANTYNIPMMEVFRTDYLKQSVNSGTLKKIEGFYRLINKWKMQQNEFTLVEYIKGIIDDLNIIELYQESNDPKDQSRVENIMEFVAASEEFESKFYQEYGIAPSLQDFAQSISLQSDLNEEVKTDNTVYLMTMHNAKGLEFPHVYVAGLEEGILPHSMSSSSDNEIEEERRLFYVAITRARRSVMLTYAKSRRVYDTFKYNIPSMFLKEIDDDLIDMKQNTFFELQAPKPNPVKVWKKESKQNFFPGEIVEHKDFGMGIILSVEGSDIGAKLTISFKKGQIKKINGNFVQKTKNSQEE